MLCVARLRHVAGTEWGAKWYLNMGLLHDQAIDFAKEVLDRGANREYV